MKRVGVGILAALCIFCTAFAALLPVGLSSPAAYDAAAERTADAADSLVGFGQGEEAILTADISSETRGKPAADEALPDGIPIWGGEIPVFDGDADAFVASCSFDGGTGKTSDPYRIATPEQFVYFIELCNNSIVDKTNNSGAFFYSLSYVITEDLCFNPDFATEDGNVVDPTGLHSAPVLESGKSFRGTLDGGGHRLYNLYMPKGLGLFSKIEQNATIKNLHLVRGYLFSNNATSGILVASCSGTVINCTVSAVGSLSAGGGGIVGTMEGAKSSVSYCEFLGEIYAGGRATGGIVGYFSTPLVTCTITGCVNRGKVQSYGDKVGGIIGSVYSGANTVGGLAISACINYGEVISTVVPNEQHPSAYVGGIVGYINRVRASEKTISLSVNFGTVRATSAPIAGGIIGYVGSTMAPDSVMNLTSCFGLGSVSAPSSVGGLVGRVSGYLTVSRCVTGGTVSGDSSVGGVVGSAWAASQYVSGKVLVDATLIRGEIMASVEDAGGIIGTLRTNNSVQLSGSLVSACVRGATNIGGLIGCFRADVGMKSTLTVEDSLQDARLILTSSEGVYGLAAGGNSGSVSVGGNFSYFYLHPMAILGLPDTPEEALDVSRAPALRGAAEGSSFAFLAWSGEALTDGTYLGILNLYADAAGYPQWKQGAETPLSPALAVMEALPLSRTYDGSPTSLSDSAWTGASVLARYFRYDSETDTWEEITDAPVDAGTYRVEMAVLSSRISGAAVREFTIARAPLDISACKWPSRPGDPTAPDYRANEFEYNGEEQVFTLLGLPEGVVASYAGNSATTLGTYEARLTGVTDTTGNYDLIGVEAVPVFSYSIVRIRIDFDNICWRGGEGGGNPALSYNEAEQTILLYDVTHPDVDLSRIMTITYGGNSGTVAGDYYATAVIADDERMNSVQAIHRSLRFETSWRIEKRVIDLADYLDFEDLTVTYDGEEHTLSYVSHLPPCVRIEGATEGSHTDVGVYEYTVACTLTDTENNILTAPILSRYLTIQKATPKIVASGRDTTYDGNVQKIEEEKCRLTVSGSRLTVPGELRFEYYHVSEEDDVLTRVEGDAPVHGGDYQVKVIYDGSENFEAVSISVPLYINRAVLAIDGSIILRNAELLWTGEPLNLRLRNEELLPDCVIPVYSAPRTDPGVYQVAVNFEFTEEHKTDYQPISGMSATLTILTYRLVDEETSLRVQFPDGSPMPYRLLVQARTDTNAFNTHWSIGFHTSLKALWQVELKSGSDRVESTEEPFDVFLPLTAAQASNETLTAVAVKIDERGKYTTTALSGAKVVEIDGEYYLRVTTNEVSYFGVVTKDSTGGQVLWTVLALVAAVPAAVILTMGLVRHIRRKRQEK